MKNTFLIIVLVLTANLKSFGQISLNRVNAETAVSKYLNSKYKKYYPTGFGEFYIEKDSIKVQAKLKTKRHVLYTIQHSYSINNKNGHDMYFHLDKNYEVVGKLKELDIMEITNYWDKEDAKRDSLNKIRQ